MMNRRDKVGGSSYPCGRSYYCVPKKLLKDGILVPIPASFPEIFCGFLYSCFQKLILVEVSWILMFDVGKMPNLQNHRVTLLWSYIALLYGIGILL